MSVEASIDTTVFSARCRRLLAEDLQRGQRIETLLAHNPFRA